MGRLNDLLLRELPDAVAITTPAGEIVYWNGGAERLFGYSSSEAVGSSADFLVFGYVGHEAKAALRLLDDVGGVFQRLERVGERAPPVFHSGAQDVEVALQQHDVGALTGDVHGLVNGDADIGRVQRGGVVVLRHRGGGAAAAGYQAK